MILSVAVAGEEQVRGLDVAVDDALLVGVLQAVADLLAEARRVARAEPSALLEDRGERQALEIAPS